MEIVQLIKNDYNTPHRMNKEFDRWNISKKAIDESDRGVNFHEREIWWCSIGVNVGSEQDSQSVDFSRPVVIVRRFTERAFWGVPLTTKTRQGQYRIRFQLDGVENDMLIWHMRSFDRKRLIRKIGMLSDSDFDLLVTLLGSVLPEKTKTPRGVFSEAEARGCKRSIEDQALLSRFFSNSFFTDIKKH
jgi:mRNA interferase MazF